MQLLIERVGKSLGSEPQMNCRTNAFGPRSSCGNERDLFVESVVCNPACRHPQTMFDTEDWRAMRVESRSA